MRTRVLISSTPSRVWQCQLGLPNLAWARAVLKQEANYTVTTESDSEKYSRGGQCTWRSEAGKGDQDMEGPQAERG